MKALFCAILAFIIGAIIFYTPPPDKIDVAKRINTKPTLEVPTDLTTLNYDAHFEENVLAKKNMEIMGDLTVLGNLDVKGKIIRSARKEIE